MLGENQTQSTIDGYFGTRVWLYPREIKGLFYRYRKWTAWFLLFIYLAVPWITVHGQPLFLLDVIDRKMVLFGWYFWPQDIRIFLPLFIAGIIAVIAFTGLFGRIWCGWACPQTVFLQFFFEPIERLIEGKALIRKKRDQGPMTFDKLWRKVLKHGLFLGFSAVIANSFLAYFWGIDNVLQAVTHSPAEHPFAFGVVVADSLLFYGIFAWFKEQACIVVCPYARFQSTLYDEKTLTVAYNEKRGEPRRQKSGSSSAKTSSRRLPSQPSPLPKPVSSETYSSEPTPTLSCGLGDCVNCGLCVQVCPTGIDIRQGLQLECIGCAKCIDACDSVMEATNKPKGLISYTSLKRLEGATHGLFRPRFWFYTSVISILLSVFGVLIGNYSSLSADLTRSGTRPYYEVGADTLSNIYTLRIRNKLPGEERISIKLKSPAGGRAFLGSPSLGLSSGELKSLPINILLPKKEITSGEMPVILEVSNSRESREVKSVFLSPKPSTMPQVERAKDAKLAAELYWGTATRPMKQILCDGLVRRVKHAQGMLHKKLTISPMFTTSG